MNRPRDAASILILALAAACVGCQQRWAFAPPGYMSSRPYARGGNRDNSPNLPYSGIAAPATDSGVVAASATEPVAPSPVPPPKESANRPVSPNPEASPAQLNLPKPWLIDPSEAPPISEPIPTPLPALDEAIDPRCIPTGGARPYDEVFAIRPRLADRMAVGWQNIKEDHIHYYSWRTFCDLAIVLGGAGVLANTSLDQDFRDWYQQDVRTSGTDRLASYWKPFGEGQIFIPAFACLTVAGHLMDEYPVGNLAGEYAGRVTRGYLVGFPSMLFLQYALGPSRPSEDNYHSGWRPFSDSHGVSGHAFMGSIPFITAARMTDNPWLAGTLYACSTFTAWSRINDDQHYLSQIILGWWMGYLATRSVAETEARDQAVTFLPLVTPEGTGAAVLCRY